MKCAHPEVICQDGGPRDPWSGYTFCADCGETVGRKWKRMIDDACERFWGFRPHRTKPAAAIRQLKDKGE